MVVCESCDVSTANCSTLHWDNTRVICSSDALSSMVVKDRWACVEFVGRVHWDIGAVADAMNDSRGH